MQKGAYIVGTVEGGASKRKGRRGEPGMTLVSSKTVIREKIGGLQRSDWGQWKSFPPMGSRGREGAPQWVVYSIGGAKTLTF